MFESENMSECVLCMYKTHAFILKIICKLLNR